VIIRINKGCSLNGSNEFLKENQTFLMLCLDGKYKKKKKKKFILKMRIGEMRDGG